MYSIMKTDKLFTTNSFIAFNYLPNLLNDTINNEGDWNRLHNVESWEPEIKDALGDFYSLGILGIKRPKSIVLCNEQIPEYVIYLYVFYPSLKCSEPIFEVAYTNRKTNLYKIFTLERTISGNFIICGVDINYHNNYNISIEKADTSIFIDKTIEILLNEKNSCISKSTTSPKVNIEVTPLLRFASLHGHMQIGSFVNTSSQERFRSTIFTNADGLKTYVAFANNMNDLSPDEISLNKEHIIVKTIGDKHKLAFEDGYKPIRKIKVISNPDLNLVYSIFNFELDPLGSVGVDSLYDKIYDSTELGIKYLETFKPISENSKAYAAFICLSFLMSNNELIENFKEYVSNVLDFVYGWIYADLKMKHEEMEYLSNGIKKDFNYMQFFKIKPLSEIIKDYNSIEIISGEEYLQRRQDKYGNDPDIIDENVKGYNKVVYLSGGNGYNGDWGLCTRNNISLPQLMNEDFFVVRGRIVTKKQLDTYEQYYYLSTIANGLYFDGSMASQNKIEPSIEIEEHVNMDIVDFMDKFLPVFTSSKELVINRTKQLLNSTVLPIKVTV